MTRRKLFCEYGPVCYHISLWKEYRLRELKDVLARTRFGQRREADYPSVVIGHRSAMLRELHGVDMRLQRNKMTNLRLAAARIDGLVVLPGETFSFWRAVGLPTERQGYLPGLTIFRGRTKSGLGGGVCQLANLIHWMALHSPLTVTELHHHSDCLFPDAGRRVPFGTGTSVFYKNVDYRFYNGTNQPVVIRLWLDDTDLCGELRTTVPFPHKYRLEEEDHHFACEDGVYYRNSRIYRRITSRATRETVARELILTNHSRVMYDPALIPQDQLRTPGREDAS